MKVNEKKEELQENALSFKILNKERPPKYEIKEKDIV